MANKLFNYFFVKKESKSKCITLYGKQREIEQRQIIISKEKVFLDKQKDLKEYFQSCLSLASSEYCASRSFSRSAQGCLR